MNYKVVKELLKRYPQIREVVDLANDYNVDCEECARIFVALVDSVSNGNGLKGICFRKHYIEGEDYLTISLDVNVAKSTAHRWVEECVVNLVDALSLVRGFNVWIDHHFPELRPLLT